MHEDGIKLLNLMFRPGESVCVSHNKYGYHSITLENVKSGSVNLVSPNPDQPIHSVDSSLLQLVALNPINGFRQDLGCTAFRNFLVEIDYGSIEEQYEYIKRIGLPYSAIVFSGNKSLHCLVSLSEDLPSELIYRKFSEWILAIATAADQNTKNPSRSIRIPGAFRENDKQQKLVEFTGSTSLYDFVTWLNRYPDCKPKEYEKRKMENIPDIEKVPRWVQGLLKNGLDPLKGRNIQWFQIACEYALAGFDEDAILDMLSVYFVPERDFNEREWKTTILSATKYIRERRS